MGHCDCLAATTISGLMAARADHHHMDAALCYFQAARQKVMDLKAAVAQWMAQPDGAFAAEGMVDAQIRLQPGFSHEVKVLMRQLRDASWETAAVLHADEEDERTTDEEVKAWLAKEQGSAEQPEQQRQQEPLIGRRRMIIATAVLVTAVAAASMARHAHNTRRS